MGKAKTDILYAAALLCIALGALWFRLPQLDLRPMHGDEANQAVKTGILLERGVYVYDPKEHHGPTLYYLAQIPLRLAGVTRLADSTEGELRILPVLFGVGLILLLWILRDGLGRAATLVAAILTAVSPAMVFYSRYYIQEMLLVFFTFAAIACLWRYLEKRLPREAPPNEFGGGMNHALPWLVAGGLAIGLMHATKETAILAWAAMAVAGAITIYFYGDRKTFRFRELLVGLLAAVTISALFFSSFFTNPRGVLDSVLTYASYFHRAGGAGLHDHPWYYYLSMLLYTKRPFGPRWSEALIVCLALVGVVAAFVSPGRADKRLLRFLAIYTGCLTLIYSLIPYKTPWSMLSFLDGMILLAGVGAVALVRWVRYLPLRVGVTVLLAFAAAQLADQAWRASYLYPADFRNPYVYAHPVPDVLRLSERVEDIAKVAPEGHSLLVKVMMPGGDYWPLPWYLRKFDHVGYWQDVPADPDADLIITSREFQPAVDAALKNKYQVEYYGLRPNIILVVYIRQDLWDAFMRSRG